MGESVDEPSMSHVRKEGKRELKVDEKEQNKKIRLDEKAEKDSAKSEKIIQIDKANENQGEIVPPSVRINSNNPALINIDKTNEIRPERESTISREIDEIMFKGEIDLSTHDFGENEEVTRLIKVGNKSSDLRKDQGMLWHIRLGHMSLKYLIKLQKLEPALKNVVFGNNILDCDICAFARLKRLPFTEKRTQALKILELIHTDVMGPISPPSFTGQYRYIVSFIDDYSRFAVVYIMKKNEVGDCFEMFLDSLRMKFGKEVKVRRVRSDNGTEYTGGKMKEICMPEKIVQEFWEPNTPQHNGVAERFNQTLQEKVRSIIFDSGVDIGIWR